MTHPQEIIEGSGNAQDAGLTLQLVTNVNNAVAAVQDATSLLEEKSRQLHVHEAVIADHNRPGHFIPGADFSFDESTGRHALVKAMPGDLVSLPDERNTTIQHSQDWAVPEYIVGSKSLEVWLDGQLCFAGDEGSRSQYHEVGDAGAKSVAIQWHMDIPPEYQINVRVR